MIVCLDVHYLPDRTSAAAVCIAEWTDSAPAFECRLDLPAADAYVPGAFYRRELPHLLAVLAQIPSVTCAVVDGFCWLGDETQPGLGAHLHTALNGLPVIGAAKTSYQGAAPVQAVYRGGSARPLWVSAAGLSLPEAAAHIASMDGPHRLPSILKRVDQLARELVQPGTV